MGEYYISMKKMYMKAWTEFSRHVTVSSAKWLWTEQWMFGVHKRQATGVSDERLLTSQITYDLLSLILPVILTGLLCSNVFLKLKTNFVQCIKNG